MSRLLSDSESDNENYQPSTTAIKTEWIQQSSTPQDMLTPFYTQENFLKTFQPPVNSQFISMMPPVSSSMPFQSSGFSGENINDSNKCMFLVMPINAKDVMSNNMYNFPTIVNPMEFFNKPMISTVTHSNRSSVMTRSNVLSASETSTIVERSLTQAFANTSSLQKKEVFKGKRTRKRAREESQAQQYEPKSFVILDKIPTIQLPKIDKVFSISENHVYLNTDLNPEIPQAQNLSASGSETRSKSWKSKCLLCSNVFKNHESLQKHISAIHPNTQVFLCELCGKTFVLRKSLDMHLSRYHAIAKINKVETPQKTSSNLPPSVPTLVASPSSSSSSSAVLAKQVKNPVTRRVGRPLKMTESRKPGRPKKILVQISSEEEPLMTRKQKQDLKRDQDLNSVRKSKRFKKLSMVPTTPITENPKSKTQRSNQEQQNPGNKDKDTAESNSEVSKKIDKKLFSEKQLVVSIVKVNTFSVEDEEKKPKGGSLNVEKSDENMKKGKNADKNVQVAVSDKKDENVQKTIDNKQGKNVQKTIDSKQGKNGQSTIGNKQAKNVQKTIDNKQGKNVEKTIDNKQGKNVQKIIDNKQGKNVQKIIDNKQGKNTQKITIDKQNENINKTIDFKQDEIVLQKMLDKGEEKIIRGKNKIDETFAEKNKVFEVLDYETLNVSEDTNTPNVEKNISTKTLAKNETINKPMKRLKRRRKVFKEKYTLSDKVRSGMLDALIEKRRHLIDTLPPPKVNKCRPSVPRKVSILRSSKQEIVTPTKPAPTAVNQNPVTIGIVLKILDTPKNQQREVQANEPPTEAGREKTLIKVFNDERTSTSVSSTQQEGTYSGCNQEVISHTTDIPSTTTNPETNVPSVDYEISNLCSHCKCVKRIVQSMVDLAKTKGIQHPKAKCPLCYKFFISLNYVKKHLEVNHLECEANTKCDIDVKDLSLFPQNVTDFKLVTCNYCDKIFTSEEFLGKHLQLSHKSIKNTAPTVKTMNLPVETDGEFLKKQIVTTNKLCCVKCNKTYASEKEYLDHIKEFHNIDDVQSEETPQKRSENLEKNLFEDFQGANDVIPVSSTSTAVSSQSKRKNSDELSSKKTSMPDPCFKCKRQFQNKEDLVMHHFNNHRTVFPFLCSVCLIGFKKREAAMTHIVVHDKVNTKVISFTKFEKVSETNENNYTQHEYLKPIKKWEISSKDQAQLKHTNTKAGKAKLNEKKANEEKPILKKSRTIVLEEILDVSDQIVCTEDSILINEKVKIQLISESINERKQKELVVPYKGTVNTENCAKSNESIKKTASNISVETLVAEKSDESAKKETNISRADTDVMEHNEKTVKNILTCEILDKNMEKETLSSSQDTVIVADNYENAEDSPKFESLDDSMEEETHISFQDEEGITDNSDLQNFEEVTDDKSVLSVEVNTEQQSTSDYSEFDNLEDSNHNSDASEVSAKSSTTDQRKRKAESPINFPKSTKLIKIGKNLVETKVKIVSDYRMNPNTIESYVCKICDKKFELQRSYSEHMFFLHDELVQDAVVKDLLTPTSDKEKKMENIESVKQGSHQKPGQMALMISLPQEVALEKLTFCEECFEDFKTRDLFVMHQFVIHNDQSLIHVCENCDAILTSVPSVRQHICDGVSSFFCEYCKLYFINGSKLMDHNMTYHFEEDVPHCCQHCKKKFLTNRMLMKHNRIIHSKDGPAQFNLSRIDGERVISKTDKAGYVSLHIIPFQTPAADKRASQQVKLRTFFNNQAYEDALKDIAASSQDKCEDTKDTKDSAIEASLCKLCKQTTSSRTNLVAHYMQSHPNVGGFCCLCAELYHKVNETSHMMDYHISPFYGRSKKKIETNSSDRVDEFMTHFEPRRLISIFMYYVIENRCIKPSNMACFMCGDKFSDVKLYQMHYLNNHDKMCVLCNVEFVSSVLAANHKARAHNSVETYLWFIQRALIFIRNMSNIDPGLSVEKTLAKVLAKSLEFGSANLSFDKQQKNFTEMFSVHKLCNLLDKVIEDFGIENDVEKSVIIVTDEDLIRHQDNIAVLASRMKQDIPSMTLVELIDLLKNYVKSLT